MNHTLRAGFATLAAAALVAGCSTSGPGPLGPRDQTQIPAGSTLVLNQALNLDPGDARVYMQNGRVMRSSLLGGLNRFRPHCSFGLEKQGNEALISTIEPDRFTTGRAYNRAYAARWPQDGVQVAGVGIGISVGVGTSFDDGASVGELTYTVEIPVSSSSQPQVDDFTCKVDRPSHWRGKLGLEFIREATGDIVTVEIAQ